MMGREKLGSLMLWVWVVAVLGAYLYMFRDLIGPVLDALGMSR